MQTQAATDVDGLIR